MNSTIREVGLDHAARALKEARHEVYYVLTLCAGFVDMRALAGDPTAQHLAARVAAAHDHMTIAGIDAATTVRGYR